jgi:hypothetical protein
MMTAPWLGKKPTAAPSKNFGDDIVSEITLGSGDLKTIYQEEVIVMKEEKDQRRPIHEALTRPQQEFLALPPEQRDEYLSALTDAWKRTFILGEEGVRFPKLEEFKTKGDQTCASDA